ncbi:MAG: heme-copper oxidase subunit III [Chloroflexi bacterium]|nr:heme-copper oxidase subunit III [Chloroflexota bacterium]MBI3040200.1 heme-copper oxidase subunit III [Chloroflexota bacterium]MBI3930880.1 heme-copper oxidase subunit III [Chloroflexota bacterium]
MALAKEIHGAYSRLHTNRLGLWLFFLSELFIFAALISSRFYLQGFYRPAELNQLLGLVISVILVLSSLTAYRAEIASAHGDQRRFRLNILFTISLGLIFLIGVVIEWREGFHFFPPSTGFGTLFFTMTGVHAFHVLTGIIALTILYFLGRSGRFTSGSYWGVEGVVKYWHFVDVAWVLIYPTLYLVS